jgi:hypothetical protein
VTTVFVDTASVVMGKVADTAPAGTVTFDGTVAFVALPFSRVTTMPLAGAGPFRVTLPTEPSCRLDARRIYRNRSERRRPHGQVAVLTTPGDGDVPHRHCADCRRDRKAGEV